MSVENIDKSNTDRIEFEIYLKSSSQSFILESYQVTLSLTSESLNINNLSFSYSAGTSQLNNVPLYGIGIYSTDGNPEMAFASGSQGTDTITSEKKRIGKFVLTNSESFNSVYPDFSWDFNGVISTILTTSGSIEFTNQSAHTIDPGNEPPLPVELSLFSAHVENNYVILNWRTETELNNYGFEIQKLKDSKIERLQDSQDWSTAGFVEGHGNSSAPIEYRFADESAAPGKWIYRLKQVDLDGTFSYSGIVEVEIKSIPHSFNLSQNYPNPFNPETVIEFTVPENGSAVLKVFNITGEEVATLFDEFAEAGKLYKTRFLGEGNSSGIYFAKLQFGDQQMIRKMTYLK